MLLSGSRRRGGGGEGGRRGLHCSAGDGVLLVAVPWSSIYIQD